MKRHILLAALAVLVCLTTAHARQRGFGWCEQGGQAAVTNGIFSSGTVSLTGGNVALGTGIQASYPACSVTVYIAGTLTPAAIYSDNNGTTLTNPFPAANNGYWYFYADDGKYDVRFSNAGIQTPFTLPDILLCDGCNGGGGGGGGVSVVLSPTGSQVIVQPSGTNLFVNRFEGIRFADQFASISAAVTDAGTNGSVIVPPLYSNTDTYAPPLSAPILDFRRNMSIFAANGSGGSSPGGAMAIGSGTGGATASGGNTSLVAGSGGTNSGAGGDIILQAGAAPAGIPGNIVLRPGTGSTGNSVVKVDVPLAVALINEGVTGTIQYQLASMNAGTAIRTSAGATAGVIGVCLFGCSTSGTAYIAQIGPANLLLDNAGTPGDYVCISSTTNGYGTDCGSTPPSTQAIGRVKALVSGATYSVLLSTGGSGSGGSSGSGAILANPSTGSGSPLAQVLQPTVSSLAGLNVVCGSGAAGTQPCFIVQTSANANAFSVLNNGTIVFGSGAGGLIQVGGIQVAQTTVAFSATPVFNLLLGDTFLITLTGDVTSSTLTNMPGAGFAQRMTIVICQDSSGGHTFVWPTVMKGAMTIGTVASKCSTQEFLLSSTVGSEAWNSRDLKSRPH